MHQAAAGDRYLAADHQHRLFRIRQCAAGLPHHKRQLRRAAGADLRRQRLPRVVIAKAHTGVDMYFAEPGGRIGTDHIRRVLHGLPLRLMAADQRSQMIPAQNKLGSGAALFLHQMVNHVHIVLRRQAGIAAKLIALIGCRLQHQRVSPLSGMPQRRADDQLIGGAYGEHPDLPAGLILHCDLL